jgi:hypothetical protein
VSRATDIAWATGVFEGEGCITISDGGAGTPSLHIDMCDEDVLRKVEAIFGGSVTGPTYRTGYTPIYHWRIYGIRPVQETLRLMWPYLCQRRRTRAEEMIAEYSAADVKRKRGRGDSAAGIPPPNLDTRYARSRARKEGFDVPKQKPGPKPRTG